ncbi:MAG: bifunctional 3-(3-hydroxy-phenyl)propionate/3-hydroxycinnamic acid hydroxylase [Hyphomonadaceae bacterium]
MPAHLDCDVLIVGGGPTGATLALMLARRGVNTLVIDKEADIYPLPRAAHVDHEIMRIFQELGIADEIETTCRHTTRYDFLNADGEVLLRFEGSDRIGLGGWRVANMVHQPSIEAILRRNLDKQDGVALKSGWRFETCEETDDGIVSAISTPDGPRTVRSAYIVGTDGARSVVRETAGIAFDDLHFDEPWLVIDAIVHDASRLPEINLQICDPARPTTCVLMGMGRHRWEFMLLPGETAEQVSDDAFIANLLAPWNVEGAVTLERKAVYRFNAKVAKQWRKGRVLLAGDAAHLMPPFAGQGMCSGLRDAANLAWKFAAIKDGAGARLLDHYQTEREPHVRGIIGLAMMMGRAVCIIEPEAARVRDEQMIAARAAGNAPSAPPSQPLLGGCLSEGATAAGTYFRQPISKEARLDNVLGPGAWLIERAAVSQKRGQQLTRVSVDDISLAPFKDALATWFDEHQVSAVLVRPDRYAFGAGDAEMLLSAWTKETT